MSSSYAAQKPAKSSVSASLTFGTSSVCVPSRLLHVDGEAEVHVLVADDDGLAVVGARSRSSAPGNVVERAQHRVAR